MWQVILYYYWNWCREINLLTPSFSSVNQQPLEIKIFIVPTPLTTFILQQLLLIYLPFFIQRCCSHWRERMEFEHLARNFGCLAAQARQINQNDLCTSQNTKDWRCKGSACSVSDQCPADFVQHNRCIWSFLLENINSDHTSAWDCSSGPTWAGNENVFLSMRNTLEQ